MIKISDDVLQKGNVLFQNYFLKKERFLEDLTKKIQLNFILNIFQVFFFNPDPLSCRSYFPPRTLTEFYSLNLT